MSIGMDTDNPASKSGESSAQRASSPGKPSPSRSTKAKFETLGGKQKSEWGVVHLYRDSEETSSKKSGQVELYNATDNIAATTPTDGHGSGSTSSDGGMDYTTLCIPAVPSYFNPNDFLGFVGEKTWEQVSNFRLVVTNQKNKYLVLMKFHDNDVARRWRSEWDGKIYNVIEPETCNVYFIKSITFQTQSASFPQLSHDPFTSSTSTSLSPFPPQTSSMAELPTCPVCLERMDETASLLTTQCQHVFHCACLQKWESRSCPVCRHTNMSHEPTFPPFGSGQEALCSTCDSPNDLWICLICGHVGCGRYSGGHARDHWKETVHNFSLEIETQHIWDYTGDGFRGDWVHRLIRTKGDDKIEAMPAAETAEDNTADEDMVPRQKYDEMANDYVEMLKDILRQKDALFEQRLSQALKEAADATSAANSAAARADEATKAFNELKLSHEALQVELSTTEKDLAREKAKAEKASSLAREFSTKFQDEKTVSTGLLAKINHLKPKLEDKDKEIRRLEKEKTDLEEMNNDLAVNLATAVQMNGLSEADREGATLSVPSQRKGKGKGKK